MNDEAPKRKKRPYIKSTRRFRPISIHKVDQFMLRFLEPFAASEGAGTTSAGIIRWAIVKQARQLGWQPPPFKKRTRKKSGLKRRKSNA